MCVLERILGLGGAGKGNLFLNADDVVLVTELVRKAEKPTLSSPKSKVVVSRQVRVPAVLLRKAYNPHSQDEQRHCMDCPWRVHRSFQETLAWEEMWLDIHGVSVYPFGALCGTPFGGHKCGKSHRQSAACALPWRPAPVECCNLAPLLLLKFVWV